MRSSLLGELETAGLNPQALPKLDALTARQRVPVMEAMSAALGVTCTGCHATQDDFKTETRNKQLARHMWNDLVAAARLDGGPLFCDSCHQGSQKVLDRHATDELKAYMKTEYSGRLTTHTGDELQCASCHGKPFEAKVFEKRWNIGPG